MRKQTKGRLCSPLLETFYGFLSAHWYDINPTPFIVAMFFTLLSIDHGQIEKGQGL
jgi:hypothetical protein